LISSNICSTPSVRSHRLRFVVGQIGHLGMPVQHQGRDVLDVGAAIAVLGDLTAARSGQQ
jgi:hypothetical protein